MKLGQGLVLAAGFVLGLGAAPAIAHSGPPFPIVEDRTESGYRVSIWTDPDATDDGTAGGQFWILVHAADGSDAPADTRVSFAVAPRDGSSATRSTLAEPAPREPSRYFGVVLLDHEGAWDVTVTLDGPLGRAAIASEVDATYDLRPPLTMLWVYALPFVLVAFLWLKAIHGRRRYGPVPRKGSAALVCPLLLASIVSGCSEHAPEVSDAAYREAVKAFYTGLAAMQTSQEPLARERFQRVIELVPQEPAAWANLGLLKMRQPDLEAAAVSLARAAEMAPKSAHVQQLLALLESRSGRLDAAIRHWEQALELDPSDVRARYNLALDAERQGGDEGAARAQRELEALVAQNDNLVARLEWARIAAKRGDAEAFSRSIAPLAQAAQSWPDEARERLADLQASTANLSDAALEVAYLKNVLIAQPSYRRQLAALSTPLAEVGHPLEKMLVLPTPAPAPAAADDTLSFELEPLAEAEGVAWIGTIWTADEPGAAVVLGGEQGTTVRGSTVDSSSRNVGVVADLNHDYRMDLLLAGPGGVSLLRQEESGSFTDVTSRASWPAEIAKSRVFGAWAVDADVEGDLDVVLAPTEGAPIVLRNNGDDTFATGEPFEGIEGLRGLVWADLDGDGVPDAALLDSSGAVHLYVNLRGGAFRRLELPAGTPPAVAIAAAEADGDGIADVLLLAGDGGLHRLGRQEDGVWRSSELARFDGAPAGLAPGEARLLAGDLDNNAALDWVAAGASSSSVLMGGPAGFSSKATGWEGFAARAIVDLEGDGRLEVLGSSAEGRPLVARSRSEKSYHWQAFRPRSASTVGDQRINSFGIGGEIELRSGLHLQKRLIDAPRIHFGLGEATQADVVRILWPNGMLQSEFDATADTVLAASQRLKGSCPWLFAWNGREMAFVTDLIWRSPLGLRINAQGTADVLMTEDWVKLREDQLEARGSAYDLRITAELWESHFFDMVSLRALEHPAGTEVWIDERFVIPPPVFRPIVTEPAQAWLAARDDQGRDVSELLRARDGRHLDFAGRGPYQGVTREHFIELELPETAPREGALWLLATGWVHPTDSSINLAMTQGDHPRPRSLTLAVGDGTSFREVGTDLGFPSGKNKTIALDLSGLFPPSGRRWVRLSTNLEVFWDRLAWAVGRPDVRVEPRLLALLDAELLPRGYSVAEQADPSSPELPRYELAGTTPRWLDLEGFYTRFGDVRELLVEVDDRYVIMNAGDEIRLRFAAEAPAAAGTIRDYVLVGDGWVKDGDFNTGFSRTVLPLPTHDDASYDDPPGSLEDDPVYLRHSSDFETYHTRYVTPAAARAAIRTSASENP